MDENRRVKDVAGYLKEVLKIKTEWPNSTLVFRGQENEEWLLEASAERRLKASLSSQHRIPDQLFLEYHEDLLKKCKLKNYNQRERKQLDDLELLADLQHHRTATCLLDFTRNALIALWFACETSEVNGKVFVVNTADAKTFLEITPADIEDKSISDILEFKTRETDNDQTTGHPTLETLAVSPNKPTFWYWAPAHLNERITAQHSLFLFGLPSSGDLNSEKIIIESASKEPIRQELEELHDIREESLFPDFVGFAYTQRYNAPYPTPDAKEYIHRGGEALQRGQYSDAIEDFTKAIEINPEYTEVYAIRGLIYSGQGEYDHAIEDFTKAIEINSEYADAYCARARNYLSQGEWNHAIEDSTKAIEINPEYTDAYDIRARVYFSQDEYDRAIEDSTKAIEINPEYAEAYDIRAHAYFGQGEHNHAIEDFTKAIEINPEYVDAYYARGSTYGSQGECDRAIEDFTKVIELKPEFANAYRARAYAYSIQGEHDRVIKDSTKAIEINPDHAESYYDRACAWLALEKWQETKFDLAAAKNAGLDIVATFRRYNKSVADFEQKFGITLPEDIAAMLTESEN